MATTTQDHSASSIDAQAATGQSSAKAVGSFVTGLLGFLAFIVPFVGFILGIVAVALGASARGDAKRVGAGTGFATAGLILGAIAIALSIGLFVVALAA